MEDQDPKYPIDPYVSLLALPAHLSTALRTRRKQEVRSEQVRREAEDQRSAETTPWSVIATPKELTLGAPRLRGRGPQIRLLNEANLRAAHRRAETGSRERQRREHAMRALERVAERGLKRRVRQESKVREHLAHLRQTLPNFAAVIDAIDLQWDLANAARRPLRLTPMLLDGPPGVGKTYFAQTLAEAIGTGFMRVSMETSQTAADLAGTAEYWGNSQPGRLFNILIEGDFANPLVLLDEVDKAGGGDGHRADRALYALLERNSAREWSDLAYPTLQIDASYVTYVLTSNQARRVPWPLRSRVQEFWIAPLTGREACEMVRRIFRQEVEELGRLRFEPELHIGLAHSLAHLTPRELVRVSQLMIANAVREQRTEVCAKDLAVLGPNNTPLGQLEAKFGPTIYGAAQ